MERGGDGKFGGTRVGKERDRSPVAAAALTPGRWRFSDAAAGLEPLRAGTARAPGGGRLTWGEEFSGVVRHSFFPATLTVGLT